MTIGRRIKKLEKAKNGTEPVITPRRTIYRNREAARTSHSWPTE